VAAAASGCASFARPKSSTFTTPSGDLDVRGLQIAVDDAVLVRGFERLGDLSRDRQGVLRRVSAPAYPIGDRVALDQLEDERVRFAAVLEPVDRPDVRMVQ
jgi:hypothetical protein